MEKQKITPFQIVITILLIGFGLGIIAALDDGDAQKEQMREEQIREAWDVQSNSYPDGIREDFMEYCAITPEMEDYCECSFDHIEEKNTLGEFYEISKKMENQEEMPEELVEAAEECYHLIEYDE